MAKTGRRLLRADLHRSESEDSNDYSRSIGQPRSFDEGDKHWIDEITLGRIDDHEEFENAYDMEKGEMHVTYVPKPIQQRHHCAWLPRALMCISVVVTVASLGVGGYIVGKHIQKEKATRNGDSPSSLMNDSSNETTSVDMTDMSRIEQIYRVVSPLSDPHFLTHNFTMARTPQEQALEWLAIIDPNQIPVDDPLLTQKYGLLTIFYALGGDGWTNNTNWLVELDLCKWSGVSCDETGTIKGLDLAARNLKGFIPDEIAALITLEVLALHTNPLLKQELPDEIGELTNLRELHIYDTSLSGKIPVTLGKLNSLQELYLHRNLLQGDIPHEITKLTNLEELLLYKNRLSGPIPADIGKLTNLKRLWLSDNALIGALPSSIGDMDNLRALYVENNKLEGDLPGYLGSADQLFDVRLSNNTFTGPIPEAWVSLSDSLYILYLNHNQLAGNIPDWMGAMPNLQFLKLNNNQLQGTLPSSLSKATSLRTLDLSSNLFQGSIPDALSNLQHLETLDLHNNQFNGSIPTSLAQLKHLKKLDLTQNKLNGSVPPPLCGLSIADFVVDCTILCPCCKTCFSGGNKIDAIMGRTSDSP